jgi:hypothetical protein
MVEVNPEDDNVEEDEEYNIEVLFRNDAFWDEVLSIDTDASELDVEEHVESTNAGGSGVVEDAGMKMRMIGKGMQMMHPMYMRKIVKGMQRIHPMQMLKK